MRGQRHQCRHGTRRLQPALHQWLKDPSVPDWKFPFRPGYSAAGRVVAVGSEIKGWHPGQRVSYPGNHASHELLTIGHERCRLWKMPENLAYEKAALACISRYGFGGVLRAGLTLGRSVGVLGSASSAILHCVASAGGRLQSSRRY